MALFTDGRLCFSDDRDYRFVVEMSDIGPGFYDFYYEQYDAEKKEWTRLDGASISPKFFAIATRAAEAISEFEEQATKIYGP